MALDFPSSPTVGQLYPVTPIPGVPQYRWNGSAWMAVDVPTPPSLIGAGTVMLFYQASAPIGWTKLTAHNDKALRVVSGVGGASGGTNPFSTVMAQSVVGGTTLGLAGLPAGITSNATQNVFVNPAGNPANAFEYFGVSGTFTSYQIAAGATGVWVIGGVGSGATMITSSHYGSNNITVNSNNTGGGSHNHPITMGIQYLDVILASKD